MKAHRWATALLGGFPLVLAACNSVGNEQGISLSSSVQTSATAGPHAEGRIPFIVPPTNRMTLRSTVGTHSIGAGSGSGPSTLFVVDYGGGTAKTGAVQLYKYPSLKYIGALPQPPGGFDFPEGACSDEKGNVYIANSGDTIDGGSIDEYSHAGKLLRDLGDPGGYPVGCAVDPTSGDLDVVTFVTFNHTAGGIEVYKHAKLPATLYTDPSIYYYTFAGFDDSSGTLYLDGLESDHSTFKYASMKNGTFTNIALTGATIGFPGVVQWSSKTQSMNVGDQDNAIVYQVDPNGKVTGSTPLKFSADIAQAAIDGSRLIGPDVTYHEVGVYRYPSGGNPISTFGNEQFLYPIAAVVSSRGNN
jgi:hypothetical protein